MGSTSRSIVLHGVTKWDLRFMALADHIALWSHDPSSKIGAVIVRPDKTVASVGFNGFARGLSDAPELYADRAFKIATVVHAEQNAILFAREPLHGYTIYTSGLPPCAACASVIIQAGITRVVSYDDPVPERWQENMDWAERNLRQAGVWISRYPRQMQEQPCSAA